MIIVMKPNAPESAIRSITEVICSKGLQTHLSEGEHSEGITLSQPLGESLAIVSAPGARGGHVVNSSGGHHHRRSGR